MNKVEVIWIDKSIDSIDFYCSLLNIKQQIKIKKFTDFDEAFEYYKLNSKKISFIISNYCTTSWYDLFKPQYEDMLFKNSFIFFDYIMQIDQNAKIILFSSIADLDTRLEEFLQLKNFSYIQKSSFATLDQFFLKTANKNSHLEWD